MSENRESIERQIEMPNNSVKIDQVRNIPGGALLRTIPGQQARYMMATPVQGSQGAVISSNTSIQAQVLPKASVPGVVTVANQTNVSRLNTVPIQAATTASYHVPRGPAAVANIAVPRSSVATPIIRTPSNLQTIGVTSQHTITGGVTPGSSIVRPVIGVAPWLGVTTCLPSAQAQTTTTRQSVQQIRTPPITVGTRVAVGGQIRPIGDTQANLTQGSRPVLLHTTTTHKQVTLTHQTQVQVTDKAVLKSYTAATPGSGTSGVGGLGGGAAGGAPGVGGRVGGISRLSATSLPPMVSLHPAVLVPGGSSIPLKGTTAQAKVITQPTHASMQISSVPVSSVQQSAIAISTVVTRPVMITGGSTVTGMSVTTGGTAGIMRPTNPKVFHTTNDQSSPVYIHTQTHKTQQGGTVTGVVSLANTMYSLPAGTYYEGPTFPIGVATRPATTQQPKQTQPPTSQAQNITNSSQPVRFNPVMVVDSSRTQVHPFVPSSEGIGSGNGVEVRDICGGVSTNTLALATVGAATPSLTGSLTSKQNTSPRPSILRKRDPEGSPLKAQKNLNPVLTSLSVATPSSPPSPPKRPESGNGGQSSGGSTTISATSSPGGGPESPPSTVSQSQQSIPTTISHSQQTHSLTNQRGDERPPPPPPPTMEMSPRKKPRKQQLTGNQMSEPTFSEDEMEFITEDKFKKEIKEELIEDHEKCLPRRTMSLLNSYRHNWKSRNNHFVRYTDVKIKEEKKPTLSELANQKQALQKINGWKIYHLGSQIEDMVHSESEYFGTYTSLLAFLEHKQKKTKSKDLDRDINRVSERIKANFQRSKVVTDQMVEAKSQVLKLFDHKGYVADIINRSASKRSLKKRERM